VVDGRWLGGGSWSPKSHPRGQHQPDTLAIVKFYDFICRSFSEQDTQTDILSRSVGEEELSPAIKHSKDERVCRRQLYFLGCPPRKMQAKAISLATLTRPQGTGCITTQGENN